MNMKTARSTARQRESMTSFQRGVALYEIKTLGHFHKEDKDGFDRTLIELQMGMYITHDWPQAEAKQVWQRIRPEQYCIHERGKLWSERGYSISGLVNGMLRKDLSADSVAESCSE